MLPTTREDEDSRPGNAGTGTPSTLPLRNHLLNSVAPAELKPLRPHLLGHPVEIAQDEVLHRRGEPVVHVFFPEKGLVSLTADTMDGGGSAEVAMTGREGLVGAAVLLDPEAVATHEAFVQIPGTAWRVPTQVVRAAGARGRRAPPRAARAPAALRAVSHGPDRAGSGLQRPPQPVAAAGALAADGARSGGWRRTGAAPGGGLAHARRAPGRGEPGRACAAGWRADPSGSRSHNGARPPWARSGRVRLLSRRPRWRSAYPWSGF